MKIAPAGYVLAVLSFISVSAIADDSLSPEKQQVIDEVDALESAIVDMSAELWSFSEIALQEHRSAELLASVLEAEGFTVRRPQGPERRGHGRSGRRRRRGEHHG